VEGLPAGFLAETLGRRLLLVVEEQLFGGAVVVWPAMVFGRSVVPWRCC